MRTTQLSMDRSPIVSANGGTPESLIKDKSHVLALPQILQDGKSILYTSATNFTQMKVMARPLKSGEPKELFEGGFARYIPTGHIIYQLPNNNNLFAVPFDLDKLEVKGGPVPIVEAARQAVVSDSGTLVYIPGTAGATAIAQRTLVWMDRNGKEEPLAAAPNAYAFPRLSPDGTRIALTIGGNPNSNIWIWDLVRKTMTRLTFDETADVFPLWTPDGKRIAFYTAGKGKYSIYWKAADGTGKDESLISLTDGLLLPSSWSGDGKTLILEEITGGAATVLAPRLAGMLTSRTASLGSGGSTQVGIGALSVEGDHVRKPLLQGKFTESNPQISPDGRWIAYFSNESGQAEVYVRPFPQVDSGKWQVSTGGGNQPRWSRNGRELFYRSGDWMMAVSVNTEPTFKAGTQEKLFRGTYYTFFGHMWDLSSDGKRFLMIKPEPGSESPTPEARQRINIVLNWFEELKQRVPVK